MVFVLVVMERTGAQKKKKRKGKANLRCSFLKKIK